MAGEVRNDNRPPEKLDEKFKEVARQDKEKKKHKKGKRRDLPSDSDWETTQNNIFFRKCPARQSSGHLMDVVLCRESGKYRLIWHVIRP